VLFYFPSFGCEGKLYASVTQLRADYSSIVSTVCFRPAPEIGGLGPRIKIQAALVCAQSIFCVIGNRNHCAKLIYFFASGAFLRPKVALIFT
jgi:hypothetical protein